jgi:hypothetical protein
MYAAAQQQQQHATLNSPYAAVEHVCAAVLIHQCLCNEGACPSTCATSHTLQQQEAFKHITSLSLRPAAAAAAVAPELLAVSIQR